MKNSISQIVIVNYYKREKEGKFLKKLIEISAKKYGIPVQICFDDGSDGLLKNYLNSLTMGGGNGGSHRLVVHDDITFDRNILDKIIHVLEKAPSNSILQFYNPTNSDYKDCAKNNRHVLKTSQNFWVQCGVYPNSFGPHFAKEIMEWSKPGVGEDHCLAAYVRLHQVPLFAIVPSLIQHLGAFRSTFNNSGIVGNCIRNSSTYDTQFDVYNVDWAYEFANPVKSKMDNNYIKEIYKEEYFKNELK